MSRAKAIKLTNKQTNKTTAVIHKNSHGLILTANGIFKELF